MKFKIVIEGRHCLITVDNHTQKFGFFTTRYIEAESPSMAEHDAIALIRNELIGVVLNETSNPPLISIDEVEEVDSFGVNPRPSAGFTWFLEEQS